MLERKAMVRFCEVLTKLGQITFEESLLGFVVVGYPSVRCNLVSVQFMSFLVTEEFTFLRGIANSKIRLRV